MKHDRTEQLITSNAYDKMPQKSTASIYSRTSGKKSKKRVSTVNKSTRASSPKKLMSQ